MSLRKPPVSTPALLAARRRNAQKSTGPRTARGKAWSRLNGLRTGWRSPTYRQLWLALAGAPPCAVTRTARAILTPELAAHPVFEEVVNLFRRGETKVVLDHEGDAVRLKGANQRQKKIDERSWNVV